MNARRWSRCHARRRRRIGTILAAALAVASAAALAYPIARSFLSTHDQGLSIGEYATTTGTLPDEERSRAVECARRFNETLAQCQGASIYDLAGTEGLDEAAQALDVAGDGIIGYVAIGKIDVRLPVYREDVDANAAATAAMHLRGTSLPVGGEGAHCVIYAHRGLPSAQLFRDLDKLEIGDTFSISRLDDTLVYQVDQILVVDPDDDSALRIDADGDYCTLLTCTPYGLNTHRLLVRGTHVKTIHDGEPERVREAYLVPAAAASMMTLGALEGMRLWKTRHARHLRKTLRKKG